MSKFLMPKLPEIPEMLVQHLYDLGAPENFLGIWHIEFLRYYAAYLKNQNKCQTDVWIISNKLGIHDDAAFGEPIILDELYNRWGTSGGFQLIHDAIADAWDGSDF
jgi:hypothetical protein